MILPAARRAPNDFDPEYFLSARHLHVTGIAPALSKTSLELAHHAIDQMRAAGKSISFDPNLRPVLWSSKQTMIDQLNALAAKCDWVLPGIEEGRVLTLSKIFWALPIFFVSSCH